MSTTAKVLIGCGIAAVLVVVLLVAVFGVGAWFLDRQLGDADAGLARQAEVTRTLTALERDVDFRPPADGVIRPERAELFFRVTDESWGETREWAADMQRRAEAAERRGRATFGDAMDAMRGLGRARISLAESLEQHRMPPSEYVWTGLALLRAHERMEQSPEQSGIPAQNTELARRYDAQLRDISRGDEEGEITRGSMFGVAMTFMIGEDAGRRFQGWDSLRGSAP